MVIGIPREIKDGEFRVAAIPNTVQQLVSANHKVLVETNAGLASGFTDDDYKKAGAEIIDSPKELYEKADMIYKVKEIFPQEYDYLKEGQILFTYIHSANRPEMTQVLLDKKIVGISYEDIETDKGDFPLLSPMSDIAGYTGLLMGVFYSFATNGGNGTLIGGAPGVDPAKVVILGAGNVGTCVAKYALGLGADVTIMDVNLDRLKELNTNVFPNVKTLYSSKENLCEILPRTDLLFNAVKWFPGLRLVSRDMLKLMKKGSLIVDIDAEENGAIETSHFTTHDDPVYEVDGIRHYSVPNLPSAAARTASCALSNATIPYAIQIANKGWENAAKDSAAIRKGVCFVKGTLTFEPTAIRQERSFTPVEEILGE